MTDAPKTTMNDDERQAVGLYAVLARDWTDFVDMVRETKDGTLVILHQMLTHENPKHDTRTVELNSFGARIVAGVIERRKVVANA